MSDPLRRAWLVVGWLLLAYVVWQSLVPHPLSEGVVGDKLQHVGAYALLAWWFGCALARPRAAGRAAVAAALVALGAGVELAQGHMPMREPSAADALANAAGAALGTVLAAVPALDGLGLVRRLVPAPPGRGGR